MCWYARSFFYLPHAMPIHKMEFQQHLVIVTKFINCVLHLTHQIRMCHFSHFGAFYGDKMVLVGYCVLLASFDVHKRIVKHFEKINGVDCSVVVC